MAPQPGTSRSEWAPAACPTGNLPCTAGDPSDGQMARLATVRHAVSSGHATAGHRVAHSQPQNPRTGS